MKVTEKVAKKIKRMKEGSVFGYAQLKIEPNQFAANSPILSRTITKARLKEAGYLFFTDYYRNVKV